MPQRGKTRAYEAAISALLSSSTLSEAARKAGVSKRTLIRWLQEPDFRKLYMEAKANVLKTATSILMRNAGRAAQTLEEIFESRPVPHQGARVGAAVHTLRLAMDAFVLENLEERIRKLEGQSNEY